MQAVYIFFIGAIGIIIAIAVGLEISKQIDDLVLYLLFWMLYIVTIITFINIVLVGNYYLTMKGKTGKQGEQGPSGDTGDKGSTGLCDPNCRDNVCKTQITDMIQKKLNDLNNGVPVKFSNVYIKGKIAQMCSSDEFRSLAPHNGPSNLVKYLNDIWSKWFDLLYSAGGKTYFENIAAETEFEWLSSDLNDSNELHNPFNELKKYDVFYWGMGKQYRPQISEKCYTSNDGVNPNSGAIGSILMVSNTNLFDPLGNDNGTNTQNQVSFWRARQFTSKGAVYYPVGDLAIGPTRANDNIKIVRKVGTISFSESEGPNRETILISGDIKGPVQYDLIWTNEGHTNTPFWLWRPIAPRDYIALGDVVSFTADPPFTGENAPIRCVPKSSTIRKQPNGNRFWHSSIPTTISILGFQPNNASGSFIGSSGESNCYNMFRAIIGLNASYIPETDINGSFYMLDSTKYNAEYKVGNFGENNSSPSLEKDANRVGKGYLQTTPRKDAKYSVMTYLNLKNNVSLKHEMSNLIIKLELIPNAITNAYAIKIGSGNDIKCLNFDNRVLKYSICDESLTSQIFSIIFTGNKKKQCKLQHHDTKNIINFRNGVYTLVSNTEQNNIEYQMFVMQ